MSPLFWVASVQHLCLSFGLKFNFFALISSKTDQTPIQGAAI